MKKDWKKLIKNLILVAFFIFPLAYLFAQNCPEKTTVNGPTSITFVGGVADLGGDNEAKVWFEYGTSSGNYVFQTEKITVRELGKYCITVSNLTPCTTYYYRAAMENKAGPSYGAELSKTTSCEESSTTTGKVLGATASPTGFNGKLLGELIVLPFVFSFLLLILFKPYIFEFENWLELKKIKFRENFSKKILEMKISKIKANRKL